VTVARAPSHQDVIAPAGFDALAGLSSPIIIVEASRPGLIERVLLNEFAHTSVFGTKPQSRWTLVSPDALAGHGMNVDTWVRRDWAADQAPHLADCDIGPEGNRTWWRLSFSVLEAQAPLRLLVSATPIDDLRTTIVTESSTTNAELLDEIEEMGGFGHYAFWPEERRGAWTNGMARIWSIPEVRSEREFENMVAMIHPLDLRFRSDGDEKSTVLDESQEVRIVGGDGEVRYVRSLGRRHIDDTGKVERVVRVDQDVTVLRRTEEELRLAREAASDAARAKDAFLHLMNHSLRTPLNAIIGFGEAMRDQIYGPLSSEYIQCIDTVNESANRLLELINDILDLTRLESGQYSLSKSVCDLDRVIAEVVDIAASRVTERNLRLATTPPANTVTVWGEECGLRQILVNLLEFATRSARDTHTISTALSDDGRAILRLEDDGFGLEREIETAIVDPLGTGLQTVQASGASSWFGLSLVKSFLQLHGGELQSGETSEGFFRIEVLLPR
jgi:signal transduction histidine kinase